jgi:hypothetical protein
MPDENTPTLGICVSNEDEPADSSTRLNNVGNNKNLDELTSFKIRIDTAHAQCFTTELNII